MVKLTVIQPMDLEVNPLTFPLWDVDTRAIWTFDWLTSLVQSLITARAWVPHQAPSSIDALEMHNSEFTAIQCGYLEALKYRLG